MSELNVRYNEDKTELISVPEIITIQILRTAKKISGSASDKYAFKNAKDTLESFTFESDPLLEEVGNYGFYNCIKLVEADFSMCLHLKTIGSNAFEKCYALERVELPEGLNVIGNFAFFNTKIKTLFVPNSVTFLGKSFVGFSSKLETVTFGPNIDLRSYSSHMFKGCSSLKNITIPRTMPGITGNSFEGCHSLLNIFVQEGNPELTSVNGILMNKNQSIHISMPPGKTEDYTLPNTIESIEGCGFIDSKIKHVTFNTGLRYIKSYAFRRSAISELNLPGTVETIDAYSFADCNSLVSIVFVSGLTKIGQGCFNNCKQLNSVIIPDTLKELGGGAFKGCATNIKIQFDENSQYLLDDDFFILNKAETKISQYIGENTSITIPDQVEVIQANAFSHSKLVSVAFTEKSKIQEIESGAFVGCKSLASINFPDSLTTIGMDAFKECSELTTAVFGTNVTTIGTTAFWYCSSLTTVEFKDSPTTVIKSMTFAFCSSITSLILPQSLTTIENEAFKFCSSLSTVEIPNTVNEIQYNAFESCGLESCTFEKVSKLTTFSKHLFFNCTKLSSIVFPDNLASIGYMSLAFTNFTEFTIPLKVTLLDEYCFRGCSILTNVLIPEGSALETIKYGIFSQCISLKEIKSECTNFVIDQSALYDKDKTIFYILPPASSIKYFSFPGTVTTIKDGALLDCKNLCTVFIPVSIKTIGTSAFEGCASLKNINIPANVTSIGKNAFKDCKKLTCDISIENRTPEYIAMLNEAKMPKKCFAPCNAITFRCERHISLSGLSLFLFSAIIYN